MAPPGRGRRRRTGGERREHRRRSPIGRCEARAGWPDRAAVRTGAGIGGRGRWRCETGPQRGCAYACRAARRADRHRALPAPAGRGGQHSTVAVSGCGPAREARARKRGGGGALAFGPADADGDPLARRRDGVADSPAGAAAAGRKGEAGWVGGRCGPVARLGVGRLEWTAATGSGGPWGLPGGEAGGGRGGSGGGRRGRGGTLWLPQCGLVGLGVGAGTGRARTKEGRPRRRRLTGRRPHAGRRFTSTPQPTRGEHPCCTGDSERRGVSTATDAWSRPSRVSATKLVRLPTPTCTNTRAPASW